MEASSSRRRGAAMPARSKALRGSSSAVSTSIQSLDADLLSAVFARLDHSDLVRCCAVCKSWHNIIVTSEMIEDIYFKQNPLAAGDRSLPRTSILMYLKNVALEQHRLSFLNNSVKIQQWSSHSDRVNLCRMKRGLVLTGGEDKVLRLWSAESYKCLNEYSFSDVNPLVDYDFDENKIVGMTVSRLFIWRRNVHKNNIRSFKGSFTCGLCMGYIDPDAVIGCEDGRARVIDMYSGCCSRIIRMHSGPVTCMSLTDDQLILGGSTFGRVAIADISSGEQLGFLKSSMSPTAMKALSFNSSSFLVFAGSSSGYAHCWDLRTLRPLWEVRASPNVIYSVHHLPDDTSTLAIGGLDGVLRILNQRTGEVLSSFVADVGPITSSTSTAAVKTIHGRPLTADMHIESIPRSMRPPITCLSVGTKKIVTTHNEKYTRMWKF